MSIKCDQCDNEATVHEVTVRNGVKIEKHLCEACAAQHGIAAQPNIPLEKLMSNIWLAHQQQATVRTPGPTRIPVCPTCHMTFTEFRQNGLMGCPDCYRAFEAHLVGLLERAHEGGSAHVGKRPKRVGGTIPPDAPRAKPQADDRAERVKAIRAKLDEAVKAEKYETAAKLRDELKKIIQPDLGPHATPRDGPDAP